MSSSRVSKSNSDVRYQRLTRAAENLFELPVFDLELARERNANETPAFINRVIRSLVEDGWLVDAAEDLPGPINSIPADRNPDQADCRADQIPADLHAVDRCGDFSADNAAPRQVSEKGLLGDLEDQSLRNELDRQRVASGAATTHRTVATATKDAKTNPQRKYRWNLLKGTFQPKRWAESKVFGVQISSTPPADRPRERLLALGRRQIADGGVVGHPDSQRSAG